MIIVNNDDDVDKPKSVLIQLLATSGDVCRLICPSASVTTVDRAVRTVRSLWNTCFMFMIVAFLFIS